MTRQLEDEGVEKFNKPFDKLMETLAQRSPRHLTGGSDDPIESSMKPANPRILTINGVLGLG